MGQGVCRLPPSIAEGLPLLEASWGVCKRLSIRRLPRHRRAALADCLHLCIKLRRDNRALDVKLRGMNHGRGSGGRRRLHLSKRDDRAAALGPEPFNVAR